MSVQSNLYAEKVFSEQPLALWALDDKLGFINRMPNDAYVATSWETQNIDSIVISETTQEFLPIQNAPKFEITATEATGPNGQYAEIKYSNILNFNQLSQSLGNFNVGLYFNAIGPEISSVEIACDYAGIPTELANSLRETFLIARTGSWAFISKTFATPTINQEFDLIIRVYYEYQDPAAPQPFIINGLSLGQWNEEFNTTSAGLTPVTIPAGISTLIQQGIPTEAYGLQEGTGYYAISNNTLKAKNTGVPMVFGASNVTRLFPNNGSPSLILPGFGFLNKTGQYRDYTVEMWLRAETSSSAYRRIFGPVASDDGLYVNGPFLTLKIGKANTSYFVGEWARPMLLNIRVIENAASLVVNGEQVAEMSFSTAELELPDKLSSLGLDQDWLGFYAYDDTSTVEIDAVAIYPYNVPEIVSKRRFVYGQGVEFPENINTAYNGSSIFFDYGFADYTNNYNYPDIGRWSQGVVENISTQNNILQAPSYTAPSIVTNSQTLKSSQMLADMLEAQDEENTFISLRPNSSWDSVESHIFFPSLNILQERLAAFYLVLKPTNLSTSEKVLVRIDNESTGNYFAITLVEDTIFYKLKYNSETEEVLYQFSTFVPDSIISAGIDIDKFSAAFGANVKTFFGNRNQLKVYIAGYKDFSKTFDGKIYKVGFSTTRNLSKVSGAFNAVGVANTIQNVFDEYFTDGVTQIDFTKDGGFYDDINSQWVLQEADYDGGTPSSFSLFTLIDHIASYTLIPQNRLNSFILDIAVDSYWEDYVPLTYFGQSVKDVYGKDFYELDFLQFNFSYPTPYNIGSNAYSTENAIVKTYITFQYLATGSNANDSYFTNRVPAPENGVVSPGSEWLQTKYEVVSGNVIYLPPGQDFKQLSIGLYVEMQINGIISNPIKIKSLQLASQAIPEAEPVAVGTRFGFPVFPYTRTGFYFDYKAKNPYEIYKQSNPYLYLSNHSGIRLRGEMDNTATQGRGISIPINASLADDYTVGAAQFMMKYPEKLFPITEEEVFEFQSQNKYLKFYLVATNSSRTRAKIYARNVVNGSLASGIAFYLNGNLVKDLYINLQEWSAIGIQFSDSLQFFGEAGAMRITGHILINNISTYQLSSNQSISSVILRRWSQITDLADYWFELTDATPPILWQDVLYIPTEEAYVLDPQVIYRSYIGTNRISIGDSRTFRVKDYSYNIYNDILWDSRIISAV